MLIRWRMFVLKFWQYKYLLCRLCYSDGNLAKQIVC